MSNINKIDSLFILNTKNTSYAFMEKNGFLFHVYYGEKTDNLQSLSNFALETRERAIDVFEVIGEDKISISSKPLELSFFDYGDYRTPSVVITDDCGCYVSDFKYVDYEISNEKPKIKDMPYGRQAENSQTLNVKFKSTRKNISVIVSYTVYPDINVIARSIRIINNTLEKINVEKCVSATIDFVRSDFDLLTVHGGVGNEAKIERITLPLGTYSHTSDYGSSGHYGTPFAIICEKNATDNEGCAFGFNLVYGGNFELECKVDWLKRFRFNIGINHNNFLYALDVGETFYSPEVLCTYSTCGFNGVSIAFADYAKEYIISKKFIKTPRPVVINTWESMVYDITEEKLFDLAVQAKNIGMDTLVIDDGWFSIRRWEDKGLGDWYVAPEIFPNGLKEFSKKIKSIGMNLGIWIEPEMVNPESELFKSHSEWALGYDDRLQSRNQLVLDMTNPEVVDYIFKSITSALDGVELSYIKWDFNRGICPYHSNYTKQDKEVAHKQLLGSYSLMKKLTEHYPNVLFEGCACGGGRYDLAMLYYFPQIWTSDNTDAFERCNIQYGTSFFAPISSMSCHVTKPNNIGTRLFSSLDFRGGVAFNGVFGYELDFKHLTDEDKVKLSEQILEYKRDYQDLVLNGDFYRLSNPQNSNVYAFTIVSKNKENAVLNISVVNNGRSFPEFYTKIYGLNDDYVYMLNGREYTGKALRCFGFKTAIPQMSGQSFRYTISRVK